MAVVAAPQRLGGVERGVVAQRHEGILQLGARARVGVHVARGNARHPQPPGQRRQRPVACPVVAGIGTLELHAQPLGAEGVEQPPRGGLVVHAVPGAARQAHEALGVLQHRLRLHRGLRALASRAIARVGMGVREDPAQVAPAARLAHEQRQVTAIAEVDLGSVDRPHAGVSGSLGELHRAGHGVVVGERQRDVPEIGRAVRQLFGLRHPVQERIRRMAVQLHIWRCSLHITNPG